MTRDDILRMAREVGFVAYGEDCGEYRIPTPAFHNRLERFATLVIAHDRAELEQQLRTLTMKVGSVSEYIQGRWDLADEFRAILRGKK